MNASAHTHGKTCYSRRVTEGGKISVWLSCGKVAGYSENADARTTGPTPGPWRTGDPEWSVIKAGANMQVASVKWLSVGIQGKTRRERLGAESVANARLIAAAPELLEWLKWAMDWERLGQRWNLASDTERAMINGARAAIAKAEGQEVRP